MRNVSDTPVKRSKGQRPFLEQQGREILEEAAFRREKKGHRISTQWSAEKQAQETSGQSWETQTDEREEHTVSQWTGGSISGLHVSCRRHWSDVLPQPPRGQRSPGGEIEATTDLM